MTGGSNRFLCADAEAWIEPAQVAATRRERHPDLKVEPSLLYTPLDFGTPGTNWVVEALAPREAAAIRDLAVKTAGVDVELSSGRLTVAIGPIGAPATVSSLEAAIALGARRLLFFGICGTLQPDMEIGDVIVPDLAIREEGTSYHYLAADQAAVPSPHLLDAAESLLQRHGRSYRRGPIWTTDAPYRETRTKVERFSAEGVLAVEMEVSAVYALAQYRGIEAVALLVVSDRLVGERWTGIHRNTFRSACDDVLRLLGELATT
jgi:uridine phosphorylase